MFSGGTGETPQKIELTLIITETCIHFCPGIGNEKILIRNFGVKALDKQPKML